MNNHEYDRAILGEWVDRGYGVLEDADHTIMVYYKDEGTILAVFMQTVATAAALQGVCRRHEAKLQAATEVVQ